MNRTAQAYGLTSWNKLQADTSANSLCIGAVGRNKSKPLWLAKGNWEQWRKLDSTEAHFTTAHLNISSGQGEPASSGAAPVSQVPKGKHVFFLDMSAGTKVFMAGGEADADSTGRTELRYLPLAGKLCAQSSTHSVLPGQECILPRNKLFLQIVSLNWKWRRLLSCMMASSSHHAAETSSSHQHCPDTVLWTSILVLLAWGAQGSAHQQSREMVSAILQNVRVLHSVRSKSAPRDVTELILYFRCNWLLFFKWFGFVPWQATYHTHPDNSPLGSVAPCYTRWESHPTELGCTAAWRCTCELGNMYFFQAITLDTGFTWLSCAKPLKSFVFLLWSCSSTFLPLSPCP